MGCLLSQGLNVHPIFLSCQLAWVETSENQKPEKLCGRDKKWKQNMFSFPGL